jgi:integrase
VSLLAPTLEAFFTERLLRQKNASPHTVASYRDCLRLLLGFVHDSTGTPPSKLRWDDLDAPVIGAFLDHLEWDRGLTIASRNTRLAAVHSLFRYAALRHPEHAALIQRVLAIPAKRGERAIVSFLTPPEVDALASPAVCRRGPRPVGRRLLPAGDGLAAGRGVRRRPRPTRLSTSLCRSVPIGSVAWVCGGFLPPGVDGLPPLVGVNVVRPRCAAGAPR